MIEKSVSISELKKELEGAMAQLYRIDGACMFLKNKIAELEKPEEKSTKENK